MTGKTYRVNYKSDFVLTLTSDAGWAVPFRIKFWTSAPKQAYFAGWDGQTWTHCAYDPAEPTKLKVQFDNHRLTVGELRYEISYHFEMADFPDDTEDEVLNRGSVVAEVDGMACQVVLDFNGETAPDIQFALPAYANELQRIANEEQRIANEEQRIANEEARIAAETIRQQNEAQRISNEESRVTEFARLKQESETATSDANVAATLANEKAALADDKAALADAAATLANEKAQLAADKAALAQAAATLANEKAALAQQKAAYAQTQGDYAKAQGDYAKEQGEIAEEDHERAEADHTRAESDHTQATSDHTQAGTDHSTAVNDHTQSVTDHTQADTDHTRAESDHTQAASDHTQAGADHTRAESDHTTASADHTQAGQDHTRAESDHTRAESDHAAVEVYVDSLGAFDISAYHATGGVLAKYADLAAALGTGGANIPDDLRKGGMSVKFVQSSDNKYVQYILMSTTWSTVVADWQGVDDEPTTNSENIVKSGGIFNSIASAEKKAKLLLEGGQIDSVYGHNELIYSNGVIDVPSGNVREGVSEWTYSDFIRVNSNSTMFLTENMLGGGSWGLAFYDKYKQGINVGVAYDNRTNYQITIPENAAFFRYSSNVPNSIIEITLHLVVTKEDTIPYEIDTVDNKTTKGVAIFNAFAEEQSINWITDRYYNYNGTIGTANGYECLFLKTNGCTSIKTNINTNGGYIVFFGSNSVLQSISKTNSLEQVIYLPSGTACVGLTNFHSAQTEPYVEVESLDDKLILGGGLSYDSLLTPIVWNKHHNYNAQGTIDNNKDWECAKVPVGLKYIKFNFCISGAKLVFFDAEDNVISHYTKADTSFVTLLVPSNCKSIGLSNNWKEQPNPVIYGIGLQKTLQDVIESVNDLRQDFEEEIAGDIRYKVYGLGDSTNSDNKTRGSAIDGDEKRCIHFSATKVIAKRLKAAVYVNYSAPGTNIQYAYEKSQLIPNDATLVIIVVGINDLNNHYLQMGDIDEVLAIQDAADIPETTMFGVYLKMIRQLRERLPNNAQIVCVSPYFYSSDTIRTDLVDFREGIRKMCWSIGSRKGMRFIDGCDVGINPSNWRMLCRDTVHPMMEGQTIIASKILEHITPVELADEQYDLNPTENGLAMVPTPYVPLVSE